MTSTDSARAEAWDEGYEAGRTDAEFPPATLKNPYRAARAETTTATTEDIHALDARWFERWETEQPLADKHAGYYQGRVSAIAQCREELRGLLATARTVRVHPTYTIEYQQKIADELGVGREGVLRALCLAAPLLNNEGD